MGAFEKMYSTVDCNEILYKLLDNSTTLKNEIDGNIYISERPFSSDNQDIVISSPSLSQTKPQVGYSNINIHVPDLRLKIDGIEQTKANNEKLKSIRNIVYQIISEANIANIEITIDNETPVTEDSIYEHYINIRLNWYMC